MHSFYHQAFSAEHPQNRYFSESPRPLLHPFSLACTPYIHLEQTTNTTVLQALVLPNKFSYKPSFSVSCSLHDRTPRDLFRLALRLLFYTMTSNDPTPAIASSKQANSSSSCCCLHNNKRCCRMRCCRIHAR